MLKTLRLMLLAAFTMVCGSIFAQNEATLKWEGSVGNDVLPTAMGSDISLKWERGTATSSNAPKVSYGELYFNSGNLVTIAGTSDAITITKIVFSFGSDGKAGLVTCNASGLEESSEGITTSGLVTTWEGESNSLIFRNPSADTKRRYIKKIEVTYSSTAGPVELVPELAMTANIADTYDMDTNGVFVVNYENKGTAPAENAKLALYVDGVENNSKTIGTLGNGNSGMWNAKYDVTKFEAGEHQVKLALTADDCDAVEIEKTVTFTKKAPEAAFTISAAAVTVPYDAESYDVVATLTETNNVAATNVNVELRKGVSEVLCSTQVTTIDAGATQQVTLTVAKDLFETGEKTYNLYVNNKFLSNVTVTFEEAPVVEEKDLAITGISGSIDQAQTSNSLTVNLQNLGNVDIAAATITLKAGETVLGTGSLFATVKAGETGFSQISIAKEVVDALTAGELSVTATAEVEGEDADKLDNNTFTATINVKAVPAPEATYSVTAENVSVAYGAESFNIVATVKNTSDVDATGVAVKLLKGINEVETKTIALAAGAEETVTFTVNEIGEAGKTVNYFVQVANKAQAEVEVTFEAAPEEEVKDLVITEVLGTIELANETNNVRVSVKNNGTVDINDAVVTLKAGETVLGTATVSAAKEGTGYCMIAVASEGLEAGELAVTATVEVEGDATPDDNTMEATLTVNAVPAPEAVIELAVENVEVLTTDAKVKVVVNVKNTGEAKADQFEVKLLSGTTQIGESKYVFGLEAGAEQNVTFEFDNFDKAGTYELQAVAGKAGKFFNVVVKEPAVEMTITDITGSIDLAQAANYLTVSVANTGTADVTDAKVVLTVAGEEAELGEATISVKAGKTGIVSVQIITDDLEAGTLPVHAAIVAGEETIAEFDKDITVKEETIVSEPTFSVTAANAEVTLGNETFDVVLKVKNTSEVAAENVDVKLYYRTLDPIAETTIEALAAGAEQDVTLTVNNTFTAAGTYELNAMVANKAQVHFNLVVKEAPVEEVKDLAIDYIQGSIDLNNDLSNVTVAVKNNGNVDMTNVKATLSYGETVLEKTVSAKVGENGYVFFQVASEGIEGETLNVTAAVEVEDDATPQDNTKTAELTVKQKSTAEPTFSVVAENVTVPFGAESFDIVATVTNTSEVDAENNVVVKLLKGFTEVETKTETLAGGESKDVTFTVKATEENPFVVGTTVKYYVQVANKAQAEVEVNFAKEEEAPVVDLAIESIQGTIDLALENNFITVTVKNNGNQDLTDVRLTVDAEGEGEEGDLGEATISVKAGESKLTSITLNVEGFEVGELPISVKAHVVGDATPEDNVKNATIKVSDSNVVEPQADIAINPISGWDVEAGEQTISVSVGVFNNGDADAENVKIELYKNYNDGLCEPQTVNLKAGESTFVTFTFDYTFEQGKDYEFTVYTGIADADASNNMQKFTISCPAPVADVAVAKIADITATTEDEVVIAATIKNNSSIAAENVLVALYQGTEQVEGTLTKVNEIAANGEAQVEFNLGKLAAGNYSYNVTITSTDDNMDNNVQSVTVKVTEYVAPVVNVALTAIQGISNIDLAEGANNTISVWVENAGNVDAEATIAVTLNGAAVGEAQTITVKAEKNANASFTLPTEDLVAGETATVVATVLVEGNTAEEAATTLTREYNIVNSDVATEPVFEVVAENVTVAYDATSFEIKATVKNTSSVDAENVEVKLTKGIEQVGEAQTIAKLAGNSETTLTFTVNEVAAGTYYVNVANNKAVAEVVVTVEEEPVTPVVAVALTQISLAGGQIDLAQEANIATVSVENTGNVDAQAVIGLSLNGTELEAQTITVKKESNGLASFTLPTEGLEAGQKATLVATVTVADNTAETVELTKEYDVVNSSVVTEPDFAVTAEDVTVEYGATYFEVTAVVKNTTDIDATNVEVKLLKGITEIATTTITELKGGAEQTVKFQVEPTEENPFVAGKTVTYFVQAAGKAQAEVTVTFAEEPVEEVVDLAVTSISGTLSLDVETNYLTVFVENKGTVDVTNARVALTAGDAALGEATVSAKAGATGFCSIAVPATALTAGEFTVVATVTVDGDANEEDNTLEKTYTIAAPKAELSFTVEATAKLSDTKIPVQVTVKNSEKAAAENVLVTVYDANSNKLGEATIAAIAAGAEETVTIEIENTYTAAGEYKNALQVTVAGVDGVKWATITITEETTAIAAIKAQFGENVQIFNLAGKKVNDVRKGEVYIINGKKTVIK